MPDILAGLRTGNFILSAERIGLETILYIHARMEQLNTE
jgi:hypothetical protein